MDKPWYKKWWGILVLILFWPFSLSYFLWHKKWNLKIRLGFLAALWVFVFSLIATRSGGNSQKAYTEGYQTGQNIAKSTNQPNPTQRPKQEPISTSSPTPKALSTMDKLWQAADKIFHERRGMDIHYNPTSKTVILTYGDKDSMFLNESGIVEGLLATFVEYGKQVFQLEGVDKLEVSVRTVFTDSYGKENLENAVIMDMDKEEFQKYSWDNLRFQPIYYQMKKSASELYIHPAILKKIDLGKIKLKY